MNYYYKPKKPKEVKTKVYCSGYSIEQQTTSEQKELVGEGRMIIELTFLSNDYSINKFDEFMQKFNGFLDENY